MKCSAFLVKRDLWVSNQGSVVSRRGRVKTDGERWQRPLEWCKSRGL